MKNNKKMLIMMLLVLAGCLVMACVDAILRPGYLIKSAIKLVLFLILPLSYSLIDRQVAFRNLFTLKRKILFSSFLFGAGVYALIVGAYFVAGPYFDLSNITAALKNNAGVTRNNFVPVALYISFINSFLEEFFFRGFAFLTLKQAAGRKVSYLFSASAFSLYHVAIMTSWFSLLLFALVIACLFAAGTLFNRIDEKNGTVYASWLVHMCANFAVNTVGFFLFGIL